MKFKLFTHADPATVETQVNAWLKSFPTPPTIHKSVTDVSATSVQGTITSQGKTKPSTRKVNLWNVSVWYD